MSVNGIPADELDKASRVLSRPVKVNQAFARPPPGDIPTTVFQPLTSSSPVLRPGLLGLLPLELMEMVCMSLDIASAFSLSRSSRYAREAIASVREFRLVGKHAAGCLWLYLNTQVAPHVEVRSLYSALTTRTCSFCRRSADLLSIPTVRRCCMKCFTRGHLVPSYLIDLTQGLPGCPSPKVVKRDFPVLRTIPNSYGWSQKAVSSTWNLLIISAYSQAFYTNRLSRCSPRGLIQPAARGNHCFLAATCSKTCLCNAAFSVS